MDIFLFEMSMKWMFTLKNFSNVYWHGKTHSAMIGPRSDQNKFHSHPNSWICSHDENYGIFEPDPVVFLATSFWKLVLHKEHFFNYLTMKLPLSTLQYSDSVFQVASTLFNLSGLAADLRLKWTWEMCRRCWSPLSQISFRIHQKSELC